MFLQVFPELAEVTLRSLLAFVLAMAGLQLLFFRR